MSVDRNEKIWAYSNSGNLMHAFVQVWKDKDGNEGTEYLRALCRGTIARHKDSVFSSARYAIGVCARCEKLANAMWDRAEASMEPADPYSDGFHTVDETTVLDALHAEALRIHKARTTDEPIIAANEAEAIALRAERQQARRVAASDNRETEKNPDASCNNCRWRLATSGECMNCRWVNPSSDETTVDAPLKIVGRKPMDLDRLHAEALEMDAAGEALTAAHRDAMTLLEPEEKPVRWHYRAHRMTSQGAFLGVVEGYMTDTVYAAIRVERRVRDIHETPSGTRLTNFVIRPTQ